MSEWQEIEIGKIGIVITGRTPTTKKPDNFGNDFPFITPTDMDGRRKISNTERGLSLKGAESISSARIPPNSVAVSCIGWQMGKVIMTTMTAFTNQQINTIIVQNPSVSADYVYYNLSTRREELKNLASGGTRTPILNKSSFEKIKILLPPLETQRKIAAVLSAYDDLIENNMRRIKALEEAAQSLYREWFVEFRFPGHENVPLVESELGMIPQGWEVVYLHTVCELVMGQSPKSEYYNDNGEGLPFHQGVSNFGARFPVHERYCTDENRIAETGDILVSVRAPVGRLNIADRKIVIGRGLSAIRSKNGYQHFVFELLRGNIFIEEDQMGGGTIFKAITKADMQNIKLIQPDEIIVKEFEHIISDTSDEIHNLTTQNQVLREARDGLLPRLVSGAVSVENLDIE